MGNNSRNTRPSYLRYGKTFLAYLGIPGTLISIFLAVRDLSVPEGTDLSLNTVLILLLVCLLAAIIFCTMIHEKSYSVFEQVGHLENEMEALGAFKIKAEKEANRWSRLHYNSLSKISHITKKTKQDLKKVYDRLNVGEYDKDLFENILQVFCDNVKDYSSSIIGSDCAVTLYYTELNDPTYSFSHDDIDDHCKVSWLASDDKSRPRYQGNNKSLKQSFIAHEESLFALLLKTRKFHEEANNYKNLDWYNQSRQNTQHHYASIMAFALSCDVKELPIGFLTIDIKKGEFTEDHAIALAPLVDLCYLLAGIIIDKTVERKNWLRNSRDTSSSNSQKRI